MGARVRVICVCLLATVATQGLSAASPEHRSARKRWIFSAATLVAASLADGFSSQGKYELNPLLRSADGRFSAGRAIAVKSALTAGILGVQWLAARHNTAAYRYSEYGNYAGAAALGSIAARNRSR